MKLALSSFAFCEFILCAVLKATDKNISPAIDDEIRYTLLASPAATSSKLHNIRATEKETIMMDVNRPLSSFMGIILNPALA